MPKFIIAMAVNGSFERYFGCFVHRRFCVFSPKKQLTCCLTMSANAMGATLFSVSDVPTPVGMTLYGVSGFPTPWARLCSAFLTSPCHGHIIVWGFWLPHGMGIPLFGVSDVSMSVGMILFSVSCVP